MFFVYMFIRGESHQSYERLIFSYVFPLGRCTSKKCVTDPPYGSEDC